MSRLLPRLRLDLDFMPSPVPDRPGLLIRDPFQYSDATLIIPPPLVECLAYFDGERTELDLRATLVRIAGDLQVGDLQEHLIGALSGAGFLHDETHQQMKEARHGEFACAPHREAVHAGAAYDADSEGLARTLGRYMNGVSPLSGQDNLVGIAAPHVSPQGGWQSYQAAYRALGPRYADRIFVILGTSHYGQPNRFGLTRKPFLTPFGGAVTELALVDWLEQKAGPAIQMEDYCHAIEHSIEFQVVFLQHLLGPEIRILPVLCGSFARSIQEGGMPEDDEKVKQFLDALGEMAARDGKRLFWVLGIDMAHMGRRYADPFTARADQGRMVEVAARDAHRIDRMNQADAGGFWELVQQNRDDLKWCGSSPVYTFLKAVPQVRGELHRYEQWNIDEQSVVSFAGMSFRQD